MTLVSFTTLETYMYILVPFFPLIPPEAAAVLAPLLHIDFVLIIGL